MYFVYKRRVKVGFPARLAALVLAFSVCAFGQTASTPAPTRSSRKLSANHDISVKKSYHEDWATIPLEGNTLIPQEPVLGAMDDIPGSTFVREHLQMQWRPDDPLDLFVVRPRGVEKPPVIIFLYSFPQDTDRFKDNAWCTVATSQGYAAIGFVSALTGHRMEHRAVKYWFVSELQEAMGASAHDVQMILNYLQTRGDLDMDHIGMFGQGSGGSIAILASAADPRIKALDLLTPWGDWPNWLAKATIVPDDERASYLTPEFLASAAVVDPINWLPKIKAQSLRIQDVRRDPLMPDESQEKLEAAAPDRAEINQFGDPAALLPAVAGGRLFDWIRVHVKPESVTKASIEKSERVHFYPAKGKTSPLPLPSASQAVQIPSSQP